MKITFSCLFPSYFLNYLKTGGFSLSLCSLQPPVLRLSVGQTQLFHFPSPYCLFFLRTLLSDLTCRGFHIPQFVGFWETLLLLGDSWLNGCRAEDLTVGSTGNAALGQKFSVSECLQQGSCHHLSSSLASAMSPTRLLAVGLCS